MFAATPISIVRPVLFSNALVQAPLARRVQGGSGFSLVQHYPLVSLRRSLRTTFWCSNPFDPLNSREQPDREVEKPAKKEIGGGKREGNGIDKPGRNNSDGGVSRDGGGGGGFDEWGGGGGNDPI